MDFKVISFAKSGEGKLIVKSWGSIQDWDSQNETIDLGSAMKSAPIMMALRPKVHLGHTDIEVGEITDLQKADYKDEKTGKDLPGIMVEQSYYNQFRIHKMVQKAIQNGTLDSLSMRGFSYDNKQVLKDDGKIGKVRSDVEMMTFALCSNSSAINKKAKHQEINGEPVKKADEFELELLKDDAYNSLITSLLNDGMPYTKAKQVAQDMYSESHPIRKADIEEIELEASKEKGDDKMADDELKKEVDLLKAKLAENEKSLEATKKERDDAVKKAADLQHVADKGGATGDQAPLPTQMNEMDFVRKATETPEFKKAVLEIFSKPENLDSIMKANGFVKAADGQGPPLGDIEAFAEKNPEKFIGAIKKAQDAVVNKTSNIKSAKEMAEEIRKSQ